MVMSSGEGMGCSLIRKLGSFEGLKVFFFLTSCFLTIMRSICNYPLHAAKLYEVSAYVDQILLKSNKILLCVFLFLVFLQDKIGEGIMSIILGQSPVQVYKSTLLKIKSLFLHVGSTTTVKFSIHFVTYKVMEINEVNFPII